MRKSICRALGLLLLSGPPLAAGTISGVVQDTITQKAIRNAAVILTNQTNNTVDTVYTDYSGNWSYTSSGVAVDPTDNLPQHFALAQNYPNPFNPGTRIGFSIDAPDRVDITVHNVLGQLVDHKSRQLPAGNHCIDWHSQGSSGIYFYTLRFKGQTITRKMLQLEGGQSGGLSGFRSGNRLQHAALSKTAATELQIIFEHLGYLSDTLITAVSGGENFTTRLLSVHHRATLIDLHNDVLEKMIDDTSYSLMPEHIYNHTDIPRLIRGGVDVQFFAVWIRPEDYINNYFQKAGEALSLFQREMNRYPEYIAQARTPAEAEALNQAGRIAAVLAVEGGHHIDNSIANLISLYESGMRYLTITWNNSTDWAVSAQDEYHGQSGGLSDFGRQVIRTLDSLGVIIDVSHTGVETITDILAVTENPIVATHSGVRALRNHYRNLYDNQIQAIANSGGVIGIVFYPPFLASWGTTVSISHVIQHIDYIVDLVGIDYVALGSDFDGIGTNTVSGLYDVSKFPDLTMALLEHGYTRAEVEKILGKNFQRVFEAVCGTAPALSKQ